MNIYLMGENAFVELKSPKGNSGYMLCIGNKAEVEAATQQELARMVQKAIVVSKYNCIEIFKDTRVH